MVLFNLLLHLYPRSFRMDYGDEMRAIFRQRRTAAQGPGAVIALWADTIVDTAVTAGRVHGDLLRQDVRYTLRTLVRTKGFAVTAILVATLGIGATTASFSVADHVLLRPLPFPDSDRLVRIWQNQAFRGYPRMEHSPANFLDWKQAATSVSGMSAYVTRSFNLIGQGEPERLEGVAVTAELFTALGAQAALGRAFVSADDEPAAPQVAVLSDAIWHSKFGSDPGVLGRAITLDEAPFVVVGVMPPSFEFPSRDVEIWTTLRFPPESLGDRSDTYLSVVARMKPGMTLEQVRSELSAIAADLARRYPKENAQTGASVHLLRDQVSQQARTLLLTLVAASLCMLLIACANLANLLVARALTRERELAVRAAIGANQDRLIRQMLTEGAVVAALGGVLGVILATSAVPLVARLVPNTLPVAETPALDYRMLAVAALATIGTAIGFGLLPALRMSRQVDAQALRQGARSGSSRATERIRSGLVVVEVMASVVLLVAAGLLIQAMWRVQQVDPGFRAENVLSLRTTLAPVRYGRTAVRQQFYERVISEIEALPGASRAAYISFLPMTMRGGIWPVTLNIAGLSPEALQSWAPDPSETRMASLRFATPGIFETLGVPLLAGRSISADDTLQSPRIAIVSQSFARQFWPDRDPIGQTFFIAFETRTVVGVVGDIRVRGLERESEPQAYLPSTQMNDNSLIGYMPKDLVVRASVPVATLTPLIRDIIRRADPQQPIADVRPLEAIVAAETAPRRAQVRVLAGFAGAAFVLAGIGLHGLLAFAVSSRTREIGLRMALGAQSSGILAMIFGRGFLLSLAGIVAGTAVAFGAGRWLESVLAGVNPADPPTYAAAIGLVLVMTLIGSLLPALRAMRVDPVVAMREE